MAPHDSPSGKAAKITYWIATLWLALGMLSTAAVQLLKAKSGQGGVDSVVHLGYPIYLLSLLAVLKILGVMAILMPRFPLLKEWAYAGFFFVMVGAIFSHAASGDSMSAIFPSLLLLVLTMVSWYFRPSNRRIAAVHAGVQ